jgi:hypothetical protein
MKDNSIKLFQNLPFLSIIFCLGLSSIGVCNVTYTNSDYSDSFRFEQHKGLEPPVSANPNSIKFDRFFHGTIGIDSVDWIPYRGLTGYFGGYKNWIGFGVLGSYEVGAKDKRSYIFHNRILNLSLSLSYRFMKSSIYLSGGYSVIRRSFDIIDSSSTVYHNPIASITYVSRNYKYFLFMGQVRIQGQGIMLSVGAGF